MTTAIEGQSGTILANTGSGTYVPIRPIVRIHLLGSMRATSYLGDDVLPRAKKARAALAYLCLASGARVPRSRLASTLWDRVRPEQSRVNLRQAIFDLTLAMGSLGTELISSGRATVRLNTEVCWIDALALVKPHYPDGATRADLAVLCAGELLEGFDELSTSFGEWLAKERARFKARMADMLSGVINQREDVDPNQLVSVARCLISFDPTHQAASRALMGALVKLGEQAEALREYERCRMAIWEASRVEPELASERLYEKIRAQVPRTTIPSTRAHVSTDMRHAMRTTPRTSAQGRLRVGVLTFHEGENGKGFGLPLSHEIATGLARFRWFDVIGPALLSHDLSSVGNQGYPHLDYAIEGTIVGSGRQVQIAVGLVHLTGQGQPVWNEQFDITLGQLHRLNELVTTRIVSRIDPIILHIEGQPKRRERYGATGLLLQAIPMIFNMERSQYEQAGQLIEQALALEPDNAMVEAWAAHWHLFYIGQGWATDVDKATTRVQQHALNAINLDPENAEGLGIYAHTLSYRAKDFDKAILYFERALRINPSLAFNWALSAPTYCYIGEPDIALRRLQRYRELAPPELYFSWFETLYTIAFTFKGDYARAVLFGRRAVNATPGFIAGYKPLIASLGHLGRREEALSYLRKLLSLEPNFTIERFEQMYPIKKVSDRERYVAGLRLAGVPER